MEQKEKMVEAYKRDFAKVVDIDVLKMSEQKNGYSYVNWALAWKEFCKIYPDATYEIIKNPEMNNIPVFGNEQLGYMVYTRVKVYDLEHEMWLPVLDSANMPMKFQSYEYKGWKWINGTKKQIIKTVEVITVFDINRSTMRCLTKNLAMFGLGLNVYTGEDYQADDSQNDDPRGTPLSQEEIEEREQKEREVEEKREKCIKLILKIVGEDTELLNSQLAPYGIKGLSEANNTTLAIIFDNLNIIGYKRKIMEIVGEDTASLELQLKENEIESLDEATITHLKNIHKSLTGGKKDEN